ncbi:MAG TPA: hypothetical protein DIT13_01390 [Verrucomicrobiales bacterium]|nr:hypothetical protein [Verrucomicrobiales bacterium]HRJ10758.1 hypothetical protein [Prosthecobacter sp.]HRK16813.1 hypothetical protein [Prosthecobacter sp.]
MGIWSSIREFWARHRRFLTRYGTGTLLFVSALAMGKIPVACLILGGILVIYAVDRWGEEHLLRGRMLMEQRRLEQQRKMQELKQAVGDFLGARAKQASSAPPPAGKEEDEPVPGASFIHEPPPEPPKPPVTHET